MDFFYRLKHFFGPLKQFFGRLKEFFGPLNKFFGSLNKFFGTPKDFFEALKEFFGTFKHFFGTPKEFFGRLNKFFGTSQEIFGSSNKFFGALNKLPGTSKELFWRPKDFFGRLNKLSEPSGKLPPRPRGLFWRRREILATPVASRLWLDKFPGRRRHSGHRPDATTNGPAELLPGRKELFDGACIDDEHLTTLISPLPCKNTDMPGSSAAAGIASDPPSCKIRRRKYPAPRPRGRWIRPSDNIPVSRWPSASAAIRAKACKAG